MAFGLMILISLSCSSEKKVNGPLIQYQGKISITNESYIRVYLVDYKQTRGEIQHSEHLNYLLFPGARFNLPNRLDPENGDIFPAGDNIDVRYVSAETMPGDPSTPLFDYTVSLSVNGNSVVHIKGGGDFGISPE